VKNVRRFCQYKYSDAQIGEQGRKCSLDGQRNVKFYRKTQNGSDKSLYSSSEMFDSLNFGDSRLPISVLQPGEGLSAVSFVKRRYEAKAIGEFKSTADIALLDALIFLKNYTAGAILLNEFRTQIFSDFNAQLLYEDNLNQRYLDKQGINFKNGYSLEDAQAKRKGLEEIARIEGNMPFSKYFAVLTFDGDDMGKWLSGKLLKQGQDLKSFHEKMAECLGDFAGDAWNLLNGGPGQTAYAGGDDFLGFVNPNYLLKTLLNLRKMFSVKVDKQLSSFKDKELTFSAGICIAHYKEPLSLVLQNARNMLEKAKDKDKSKKNAFGISVLKGSGENHETIWEFGKQEINVTHIGTLVKKMVEETFSNSFIKALRLEFDRLPHPDGKMLDPVLEKSFETELTRLLNRACSIRGDEELKRAEVKSLKDALWGLYDGDVNNFFQMLHIADFLHRTVNKASFTKPEPITA
jgi:CRISPR-associated protein Cmr2